MKVAVLFLVLAIGVTANPWVHIANIVQKYQEGTLTLQADTNSSCDSTTAISQLTGYLPCLTTLPTKVAPGCMGPQQSDLAAYCPKCSSQLNSAVQVLVANKCTMGEILAVFNLGCKKDSDCKTAGTFCSSTGTCGAACNSSDASSLTACGLCDFTCAPGMGTGSPTGEVCTDLTQAHMATLETNVLGYSMQVQCSKNSDGNYCLGIYDSMTAPPTCTGLGSIGCCAGTLVNFELECTSADPTMLQALKASCTSVDFTKTCGLKQASDCCAMGAAVCTPGGGGAAFGVAPAFFTLVAIVVKFLL